MTPEELKLKRELRTTRAELRKLTTTVAAVLVALDAEMKKPSTEERGRVIARISNELELVNDSARHFGLKEDFPLKKAANP